MIYRVVHRTRYQYQKPVSASYGECHLQPRSTDTQQTYQSTLAVEPLPEHFRERRDFFGNRATHYTVLEPHDSLAVTATSLVDVRDRRDRLPQVGDVTWEQVRDKLADRSGTAIRERAEEALNARQFVLRSPAVPESTAAKDYVSKSFLAGRGLIESLEDLNARFQADFEFRPGVTDVSTTAEELLEQRAGVCQDFAHLSINGLRGLGLAARYVSGYLETDPPPGKERLVGVDVSHAWVSVYVPEVGWVDIDPTNDQWVNTRYITVAWGRDYSDVPPLKGVIYTKSEHQSLEVTVDVSRVPDDDPALASVSS